MLIGIRLFARKGIRKLWTAIESDIRNFYSREATPLYAIQEAGKQYISVIFETKGLDAIQEFLTVNSMIRSATWRTRSIPLLQPYYFKLPKGHPTGLQRYSVFLQVEPRHFKEVFSRIKRLKFPESMCMSFMSFSFGEDDMVLSILARNGEEARNYVKGNIGSLDGVIGHVTSRVVKVLRLASEQRMTIHKRTFLHEKRRVPSPERTRYGRERTTMTVILRLYAWNEPAELWEAIEKNIQKCETRDFVPLYASLQEARDYMAIVAEVRNFEALNEFFLKTLSTSVNVRKSRTYPLLNPVYFLTPKDHPKNLERYIITMQVDPAGYKNVYSKIVSLDVPREVFMTYMSFSLGFDDIIMSVLAETREEAERFAEENIEKLDGVISYEVSNQLRTVRLASKKRWLAHRNKHLSSYDREHRDQFDRRYDWTEDESYLATMSEVHIRELRQED